MQEIQSIQSDDFGKLAHLVMEPGAMRNAITHEQVVVYSDVGDHLRNITGVWEQLVGLRFRSGPASPGGSRSATPCWVTCLVPNGFRRRRSRYSLDATAGYRAARRAEVRERPVASRRLLPGAATKSRRRCIFQCRWTEFRWEIHRLAIRKAVSVVYSICRRR